MHLLVFFLLGKVRLRNNIWNNWFLFLFDLSWLVVLSDRFFLLVCEQRCSNFWSCNISLLVHIARLIFHFVHGKIIGLSSWFYFSHWWDFRNLLRRRLLTWHHLLLLLTLNILALNQKTVIFGFHLIAAWCTWISDILMVVALIWLKNLPAMNAVILHAIGLVAWCLFAFCLLNPREHIFLLSWMSSTFKLQIILIDWFSHYQLLILVHGLGQFMLQIKNLVIELIYLVSECTIMLLHNCYFSLKLFI